ncbi:MAG: chloride channel protein, partial [Gemmatimonadales bacterium]
QESYFSAFHANPWVVSAAAPVLFLIAVALVRRGAQDAKGSGIPQVLLAIESAEPGVSEEPKHIAALTSLRTAGVKVLSSLVGILGGAAIGREGPTIQISASVFGWLGRQSRRLAGTADLRSFLVAGAAAGVAAAINTPLAGITFAIEEIVAGNFDLFKRRVLLAVIIAGMTAQILLGNYLYFGHQIVDDPGFQIIPEAILIAVVAGLMGGMFAWLLAIPGLARLPERWWPRALVCGMICAGLALLSDGATSGSGYEITKETLSLSIAPDANPLLPLGKLLATVMSYLSGMAGGIFSPTLSIGASLGVSIDTLGNFGQFKVAAMIGMVAFFSATVQAPLTAVVIVMEMTNERHLILPFMIAAVIAHGIGRTLMPIPLYQLLAHRYLKREQ